MKTYEIVGSANVTVYATVEAESLEDAKALAEGLDALEFEYVTNYPETPIEIDEVYEKGGNP